MILQLLIQNPIDGIIFLLAIVAALSVHEAAHAWTADRLGDNTARLLGRTSLNPIVHLDLFGSLLFLLAGFGWGKPVPVNEHRLNRRYDVIWVALAGPVSNLIFATILAIIYRFVPLVGLQHVLALFIFLNLSLMIFNLIPIPPLDGSRILKFFIPDSIYHALEQYGFIVILLLFFVLRFGSFGLSDWLFLAVSKLFLVLTGTGLTL